jgi:hypothetical protein
MLGQLVGGLVRGLFPGGRKNDASDEASMPGINFGKKSKNNKVEIHNHFHFGNLGSISKDLFGQHQPTATLASNGANQPRIERSPSGRQRIVFELESNATTGFGNGSGSDNNSGSRINWPQGFENNSSYA